MNRRRFLHRITAAATAFVVTPGVFRAIPARKNLMAACSVPYVGAYDPTGFAFRDWLEENYRIAKARARRDAKLPHDDWIRSYPPKPENSKFLLTASAV